MPQRFQYTPSFDGLRSIAVLCVLLAHASPWFEGGWIGVDLFFALSGYLITSRLQNEYYASGNISFAKFYARRALRLLPPLLICLAMANVLWQFTPHYYHPNRLLATLAGLFYFANLLTAKVLGLLAPLVAFSAKTFLSDLAYPSIDVSLSLFFTQPCFVPDNNNLSDRRI